MPVIQQHVSIIQNDSNIHTLKISPVGETIRFSDPSTLEETVSSYIFDIIINNRDLSSGSLGMYVADIFDNAYLSSVTIKNIANIPEYAFSGCAALRDLSIVNANSLGDCALSGCVSLSNFTAESVSSVGASAFTNCSSLKSFSSKNMISVGEYAFSGCAALENIQLSNTYRIDGDDTAYPCDINVTFNSYSIDAQNEIGVGQSPVWQSNLSCSDKLKIDVAGFDPNAENKTLPFGFTGYSLYDQETQTATCLSVTSLKSIIVDNNINFDTTDSYGSLDYFNYAFGLESVKFKKKLTPSMFYMDDVSAYAGYMFYNWADDNVVTQHYLSSLVVEFENNTIEEILAIENLLGEEYEGEAYPVGSLEQVPQIKCGSTYYMLSVDEENNYHYDIAHQSDTKMNVVWDSANNGWTKQD